MIVVLCARCSESLGKIVNKAEQMVGLRRSDLLLRSFVQPCFDALNYIRLFKELE